ncbi:MAG: Methyl-directed repair adenine methylase [Labilithrix sp.]|nr:Methyl-directed repair adenine methylase [Labilithrix sp.]
MVDPVPVIKWAGGKSRLLDRLLAKLPPGRFSTYAEPFVGGGAMFFRLTTYEPKLFDRAILADLNGELIALYRALKVSVDDVVARLAKYQKEHYRFEPDGRREHFYTVRELDTSTLSDAERGARLVFLNKTCFNGLWRVNNRGKFNVPYGRYDKPAILDERALRAAHEALQCATLMECDYKTVLGQLGKGDFAYLDPPYAPVSPTANFTAYSGKFGAVEQEELAKEVAALRDRKGNAMLSNAKTIEMDRLYRSEGFHVSTVSAARAINSDPSKRGVVQELVATTYKKHTKVAVPAKAVRQRVKR